MGELNERTIDGIESVRRNALFIDPKYYHLNGEQIQALRETGVDTESQSRREVQVLIEGEGETTQAGVEAEVKVEREGETSQANIELETAIENIPELRDSKDMFVRLDRVIGKVLDELQNGIENKGEN